MTTGGDLAIVHELLVRRNPKRSAIGSIHPPSIPASVKSLAARPLRGIMDGFRYEYVARRVLPLQESYGKTNADTSFMSLPHVLFIWIVMFTLNVQGHSRREW